MTDQKVFFENLKKVKYYTQSFSLIEGNSDVKFWFYYFQQYKVPRIYFKIPRVLPYKEQKEKFETDDYFKKLARESEVKKRNSIRHLIVLLLISFSVERIKNNLDILMISTRYLNWLAKVALQYLNTKR